MQTQLKLLIVGQVTYAIALGLVKTSILLSLKRIFRVFRVFRILANCAIIFCICWVAQTILIAFLICRPLSYNWDQVNQKGSCGNLLIAYVSIGIVDVVSDIIIFLLPLPLINKLNMRRSARFATMSLFSLGFFTIASGVVRTAMVYKTSFDPTYADGPTQNLIWAAVEPCVAIMVASLLVIKPLLRYARERLSTFSSSWSTRKPTKGTMQSTGTMANSKGFERVSDEENAVPLSNMSHGKIWQTTELHVDSRENFSNPAFPGRAV